MPRLDDRLADHDGRFDVRPDESGSVPDRRVRTDVGLRPDHAVLTDHGGTPGDAPRLDEAPRPDPAATLHAGPPFPGALPSAVDVLPEQVVRFADVLPLFG